MTDAWKVPGYTLEAPIGSGGSAEVWRARVLRSGDLVALKRIQVRDDAALAPVLTEAATLAALDHPNLVRLHELLQLEDAAVLVLDYAGGGSLADLLRTRGRITPGETISALAPVASALAYAHDASVTHGDVSAANVLFTEAGLPLLSDLGVARLLGTHGPVFGTPAYVDPAVALGAPPGPQSDVFLLGGVALHALTGAPTWANATADAALASARAGELRDVEPRMAAAGVPAAMSAVVCRALSIDPRRRGSAADFALDLRHSGEPVAVELTAGRRREGEGTSSAPGALPLTRHVAPRARPVLPRRPTREQRRKQLIRRSAGPAVAVIAVVAAALAWAPWQAPSSRTPPGQIPLPARRTTPSRSAPSRSAPSRSAPSRSAALSSSRTARAVADVSPWLAALDALDARRADAYERRDPALLDAVYADSALRGQDAATLLRLVPPGCGLLGVRTRYSSTALSSTTATRAVVTATAQLQRSQLVCSGRVRSTVPGMPATHLRVELIRTPKGVRIAHQQTVG